MEYYEVQHGQASKFYWLTLLTPVYVGMNFINHIKNNDIEFCVYSGKYDADCLGSGTGLNFYSERVINAIIKHCPNEINYYKIRTSRKIHNEYYLIEPKYEVSKLENVNILQNENVEQYCIEKKMLRKDLMIFGSDLVLIREIQQYKIFSVAHTSIIIISELLKHALEAIGLKNVNYEKKWTLDELD